MILDGIFLLVLVLFVAFYARKGAVKSLKGLASYAAGGAFVYAFTGPISDYAFEHTVRPVLVRNIEKAVTSGRAEESDYIWFDLLKEVSGLPVESAWDLAVYVTDHCLYDRIMPFLKLGIGVLTFILVTVFASVLIRLLASGVMKRGVAHGMDAVLGGAIGLVSGTLFVAAVSAVLILYGSTSDSMVLSVIRTLGQRLLI